MVTESSGPLTVLQRNLASADVTQGDAFPSVRFRSATTNCALRRYLGAPLP